MILQITKNEAFERFAKLQGASKYYTDEAREILTLDFKGPGAHSVSVSYSDLFKQAIDRARAQNVSLIIIGAEKYAK